MKPRGIFKVTEFKYPSGTNGWVVTGTKADGERVKEKFTVGENAYARRTELEAESKNITLATKMRSTWLDDAQIREAEVCFKRVEGTGHSVSFLVDWALKN